MDRDTRVVVVWVVIAIVGLAALNVYQRISLSNQKEELRSSLHEVVQESDGLRTALGEATAKLEFEQGRTKRFGYMSSACARLINRLEREAWSEGNAISGVLFEGWSTADLEEWADGEARYQAYVGSSAEDRFGCGMRVTNPRKYLAPVEVAPKPGAWRNGVDVPD